MTSKPGVSHEPNGERPIPIQRVAIVTVSYNTVELTAFLLWSLHRVLDWPDIEIVVIDNGSTDGSRQLLADAHDAGLCVLLVNDRNVGHGLAVNQALSFFSSWPRLPDRVWILDSDCVVTRSSVLVDVVASSAAAAAAVVGSRSGIHGTAKNGSRSTRCWSIPPRCFALTWSCSKKAETQHSPS